MRRKEEGKEREKWKRQDNWVLGETALCDHIVERLLIMVYYRRCIVYCIRRRKKEGERREIDYEDLGDWGHGTEISD